MESFLGPSILRVLGYNPHIVHDPSIACAYLVFLGDIRTPQSDSADLSSYLKGQ